ncbi:MAG: cytochrome C biogenesis protein CcdA [Maricaulis sp.]|jgi:cytochrome c-type biogenesis protein CcmH|nr:cytochrome C biogenesis protein CcdA [Maricaulis sp.]HAQ36617.1 cytochrome c-type biogenesis protein CcmH [Alphaproteobacteria bacterium]|tara:strand:+ start:215 stop:574 length:360 start_codon:yes stop_codon:yes gene_type:complete
MNVLIALLVSMQASLTPAQEDQARALMQEIRCVVCAGQSIADSDAALAEDMRGFVIERVAAGETSREVRAALAARYGDEVLLRPPFGWHTLGLWLFPLFLLAGGGMMLVRASRKQPSPS